MGKGGDYERRLCKKLSMWWTKGKRDDIFWRTSQSGGRATTRGKSGKSTFGQYGDIAATDPSGQPLLALITIEAKKGYNRSTPFDIMDKAMRNHTFANQQWDRFISQARMGAANAGTPYWMLITRRDSRTEIVTMPMRLYLKFQSTGCFGRTKNHPVPWLSFVTHEGIHAICVTLDQWLEEVTRKTIKKLLKQTKHRLVFQVKKRKKIHVRRA